MKTAKAEITAVVQCPECGDRMDVDHRVIGWEELSNFWATVTIPATRICPECLKQFKIEGIK